MQRSRGRLARALLLLLLVLSIPYALMMVATGVFFGLWDAPNPVLTIIWVLIITSPLWVGLLLVVSRKHPHRSNFLATVGWLIAGLLLVYVYR